MRHNTVSFFAGLITGQFSAYRTYGTLMEIDRVANAMIAASGRDDSLVWRHAEFTVLTAALQFDWDKYPDNPAPDEMRCLETWWNMVLKGEPDEKCLHYYTENVPQYVTMAYGKALNDALKTWTPPETRPEGQLTEEEKVDPT